MSRHIRGCAICCAASLRFPDLRWGPVKVGCIKGRVVTKGQSPKAVLLLILLSLTYINWVKFDWIYWNILDLRAFFLLLDHNENVLPVGCHHDLLGFSCGCNDKTCGLKDLEGRISIQYQVVFWTIYYTILCIYIYTSVAVNLGHPLSWAAWCSFLSATGSRSTHLETDLELRNRFWNMWEYMGILFGDYLCILCYGSMFYVKISTRSLHSLPWHMLLGPDAQEGEVIHRVQVTDDAPRLRSDTGLKPPSITTNVSWFDCRMLSWVTYCATGVYMYVNKYIYMRVYMHEHTEHIHVCTLQRVR